MRSRTAGRLPAAVYRRATMYTTLSPCDMCTGAILLYGIPRVVIGENRTFVGGEDYLRARGVEVVNLDSEECVELMDEFIAAHPEIWNEDIGEDLSAGLSYVERPPLLASEAVRCAALGERLIGNEATKASSTEHPRDIRQCARHDSSHLARHSWG